MESYWPNQSSTSAVEIVLCFNDHFLKTKKNSQIRCCQMRLDFIKSSVSVWMCAWVHVYIIIHVWMVSCVSTVFCNHLCWMLNMFVQECAASFEGQPDSHLPSLLLHYVPPHPPSSLWCCPLICRHHSRTISFPPPPSLCLWISLCHHHLPPHPHRLASTLSVSCLPFVFNLVPSLHHSVCTSVCSITPQWQASRQLSDICMNFTHSLGTIISS